jgi:hypothetical protein
MAYVTTPGGTQHAQIVQDTMDDTIDDDNDDVEETQHYSG